MDMRSFSFRLLPSAGQVDETDTDLSFAGQDREERGRGAFRDAQAPPHLGGGRRALSLQAHEDVVFDLRPPALHDSPPPLPGRRQIANRLATRRALLLSNRCSTTFQFRFAKNALTYSLRSEVP